MVLYSDAASVMAAAAVFQGQPRLSTVRESPFLPAISGELGHTKVLFEMMHDGGVSQLVVVAFSSVCASFAMGYSSFVVE
jgi:hypothetical protein